MTKNALGSRSARSPVLQCAAARRAPRGVAPALNIRAHFQAETASRDTGENSPRR